LAKKVYISVAPIAYFDENIDIQRVIDDIVLCQKAGASMVHLHSYSASGGFDPEAKLFSEIVNAVRNRVDIIIQASLGNIYEGITIEEMFRPLDHPCVSNTTFTSGTFNIDDSKAIVCTMDEMRVVRDVVACKGIRCEHQIASPEMIYNIERLDAERAFVKPDTYNIVVGHPGSQPARIDYLAAVRSLLPEGALFGVTHLHRQGGDYAMLVAGIAMGASFIRVGLEDSPWLDDDKQVSSNFELVERAANLVRMCGYEVATVAEARVMTGCQE
jgi:3-keto-5-aminohexanoate cleavage enzyme